MERKQHILQHFIKALKKPTTANGEVVPDLPWIYGVDEYKETFGKTREQTACGPSSLHMSHWKAALERECLMRVHSFFIWAAFQFSFSYDRWETSWHVMLKKKVNLSPKNSVSSSSLRVILMEP